MKGKDGWEILDDENVEVAKTKKYSEEQAKEIDNKLGTITTKLNKFDFMFS